MPIQDNLFPAEKCHCGRLLNLVHCPACGSSNCEARKKSGERLDFNDGKPPFDARGWKCRRCGLGFSDIDRAQHCEAPQFGLTVRTTKTIDSIHAATESMTAEERSAKVRELIGKVKR